MNAELTRSLVVSSFSAVAAVATFFIFRSIYLGLSFANAAVGQVDSSAQMTIASSFLAMVGGTALFAVLAVVYGVRAYRAWRSARR